MKTGDINSVFNAMKPERYKVKSINEVAKFQKQNSTTQPLKDPDKANKANKVDEVAGNLDIIPPLNQGQNMEINEKARNFLKELCADIDFSKAGYRPPLKEPLILARFDDEIINKLKDLGYKLESNELKVSTQKQLFHGMRQEKLKTNRAFSKAEFINMPKYLMTENLYIEKDCAGIRFYWQKDKVLVNYVYLTLKNGEFGLGTYGVTQKSFVDGQLKSQIIEKFVNGDGS